MPVTKADFTKRDLSSGTLGLQEYRDCSFVRAVMRDTNISNATLLGCDLRGVDPLGIIIKLSCSQGHANKIDEKSINMFLYWLIYVFDVPADIKYRIESIIGDQLISIKKLFETEHL